VGGPAVVSVAVTLLLTTSALSIVRLGFSVPVFIQHAVPRNPGHLSHDVSESLLIAALIIVVTLYVGYCGVTVWACIFALKGRTWSRTVLTIAAAMSVGMPIYFLAQPASDQTFAALLANFLIAGPASRYLGGHKPVAR
jgi:uncharacterized membrane protein YidH (DUF202 family)